MDTNINWMEVKKRVVFRIDNYEKTADYLRKNDVAHERMGDLVKIYGFDLTGVKVPGMANGAFAVGVLTNSVVKQMGMSMDEVSSAAMENMPRIRPLKITTIVQQLREMNGIVDDPAGFVMEEPPVLVVTNTAAFQGAASVFYPGVQEELKARLGGDFYILPSSIHEVLAVKKDENTLEDLRMMVSTINEAEVTPQDRLSDNIYELSEGRLKIAQTEKEKNFAKTNMDAVKNIANQRRSAERSGRTNGNLR